MMVVSRLGGLYPKLSGAVSLSVDCYPPDRRRRDLDNLLKSLQDSLVHAGVMGDDSQIRVLHLEMRDPVPEGLVHVQLAPLSAGGG